MYAKCSFLVSLYSQISLIGHLFYFKTDTSLKWTSRVGPCLPFLTPFGWLFKRWTSLLAGHIQCPSQKCQSWRLYYSTEIFCLCMQKTNKQKSMVSTYKPNNISFSLLFPFFFQNLIRTKTEAVFICWTILISLYYLLLNLSTCCTCLFQLSNNNISLFSLK